MAKLLKVYEYKVERQELPGCQILPSGVLRLDNTIPTDNPDEADVFNFPVALMYYNQPHQVEQIRNLKYMKGRQERHVFFDVSDFDQVYGLNCQFIRCNTKTKMKQFDPNTISWAWPVEPLKELSPLPEGGFKYDVSFHGWINYEPRKLAAMSCEVTEGLNCNIAKHEEFHGYYERSNPVEAAARVAGYKKSLQESRVSLCGRSIPQVFPYRFFEAMSAGRVPALFCSDYTLPWANKIDYEKCCLLYKEEQAYDAGNLIKEFLSRTSDQQIVEMGKYGMEMWERWLCRNDWAKLMTEVVEEKLIELRLWRRE